MIDGDQAAYYAYVWRANQQLAEELRAQAAAGRERIGQLLEELRQLEHDVPLAEAAARALAHRGAMPKAVREASKGQMQTARLHVLSQIRPTAAELEGRDVAHVSSGAA